LHLRPDGTASEDPISDRVFRRQLLDVLHAQEERPWASHERGWPLGPAALARLLRPFGIRPVMLRLASGRVGRGYRVESFADPFARYLPPLEPVTPLHC
jgi:putative DNA primase/helicase